MILLNDSEGRRNVPLQKNIQNMTLFSNNDTVIRSHRTTGEKGKMILDLNWKQMSIHPHARNKKYT